MIILIWISDEFPQPFLVPVLGLQDSDMDVRLQKTVTLRQKAKKFF